MHEFDDCQDYETDSRNHKVLQLSINEIIEFLKGFKVAGMPDALRKSSTIQYLCFLADKEKIDHAYIYQMAYNVTEGRERELKDRHDRLLINNIFMGPSNDGGATYPGDKGIRMEDSLSIQIHKVRLKHASVKWRDRQLYTLGIYYPEGISHSLIGIIN